MMDFLQPIRDFLGYATPQAASTAVNLLFRYNDKQELQECLAQLAREELLHYEQVMEIMTKRGLRYKPITNARYAGS